MADAIFGEVGVSLFMAATKCVSEMGQVRSRSGGCEMTILSSDHGRIVVESFFFWRKQFRDFSLKSWRKDFVASAVESEGRGSGQS